MFGVYFHHLCIHAQSQYEILPLRSVNAEHEEQLFGQAKKIATEASNRHPDNAIFNIIVRLKAKQILGDSTTTLQK